MEEPTQPPVSLKMETEHEPVPDTEAITRSSSASFASATHTAQQVATNLANNLQTMTALADASLSAPQPRPVSIAPAMCPPGTSPASTHPGPGGSLPTCQNCATSTTPLWRRDEMGSVLCNACGLFLKLHGRPRPISLKTDVIKSRNRVKTMRPDLAKQKKQNQALQGAGDMNGINQNGTRTTSQKNGHVDDTNSPISRTGTPNMYQAHMAPMYHPSLDDQFQAQQLAGFSVAGAHDGRAPSPLNGERLQSTEQLEAQNSQLKTRVSELEVIQELYRGRLVQLEEEEKLRQSQESGKIEAQLRADITMLTDTQAQLTNQLEESHRRENMLKRRLDELEEELRQLKEAKETPAESEDGHIAKKARIEEEAPKLEPSAEVPTPQSVS